MNVLVINCGSSSLKYQLINSETERRTGKGSLRENRYRRKTGISESRTVTKRSQKAAMPTHKEAIQLVLDALTNDKTGAIEESERS